MSKIILAFAGGLGLGLLLWVNSTQSQHNLQEEVKSLRAKMTQREQELATLQATSAQERQDLQDALATVQAELDAARVAAAPAAPADSPADDEAKKRFNEMVRKVGAGQIKGRLEGRLAALKARLNLTPEQEAKLQTLLEGQVEDMSAALDRFMSGQGKPSDFGLLAKLQRGDLDADATSLLTPEQQAGYAAFQLEERANRIEMKANTELIGLQSAGGMSPEQKDQAFSRLSEIATEEEDLDFNILTDAAAIRSFMDNAVQKRYQALQDILTEPQMEIYRQQVEAQMKMLSQFMPPQ